MLDDLRDLYQDVILDHSRSPRNFHRLPHPTGDAEGHNPMCGDVVHVYVSVTPEGIVDDISFEAKGCAISVASASMMTDIAKGKTVDEVTRIFELFHDMCTTDVPPGDQENRAPADVVERLNVLAGVRGFPMRVKCATLGWHTMKAAMCGHHHVSTEGDGRDH